MKKLKKICPFLIPLFVSALIVTLFRCVFFLGYVPTESMEPTLNAGSFVLGIRCFDEPEAGDIIIFRHNGAILVKRIAAKGGDTIVHRDSPVTVPENCFYVLGDNAENSYDSRYWDEPFVSYEDVIAKLLFPVK